METIHQPHRGRVQSASRYSQAIETKQKLRVLYLSGQVGLQPDGTPAPTHEGQHEEAWANVLALLANAGMGPEHLVRVNAYVVGQEQVAIYRTVRDRVLGDSKPASTLVLVAGLVDPTWVVEIEAIAAAP